MDEARSDPHLQSVRHLMVDRLTDLEIMQVSAARPELAPLFDPARPRLAELVRNPFNLNLAAGLLSGDPARVFTVRSQLDLLMLYWDQRVATGPAMYGRLAVLEKLAREMIRRRRDRLHRPHDILITSELAAMQGLLSDGVLREAQAPGYASTAAPVAFAHALLFDFTVANQVLARLEDPMHLAGHSPRNPTGLCCCGRALNCTWPRSGTATRPGRATSRWQPGSQRRARWPRTRLPKSPSANASGSRSWSR